MKTYYSLIIALFLLLTAWTEADDTAKWVTCKQSIGVCVMAPTVKTLVSISNEINTIPFSRRPAWMLSRIKSGELMLLAPCQYGELLGCKNTSCGEVAKIRIKFGDKELIGYALRVNLMQIDIDDVISELHNG